MFEKIKLFFKKIFAFFDLFEKPTALNFIYGESLPAPYTPEEEKAAIQRLSNGDEKVKNEIVEHNLRLVVYIAKKFEGSVGDVSDLVSVGAIGLMKAVNSFDPNKNIKLATFASRCIENEILMYLRKVVKRKCEVSLDEPINVDVEGNELLLSDVVGTEPDQIAKDLERKTEIEQLYKSFSALSKREFEIIKLRYGLMDSEELTQKEIADMMGISQSYISRIEKKVLGKLKKEMAKFV